MANRFVRGDRKGFGRWSEDLAARYVEARGYVILARNYWCAAGEADIVAQDGDTLVIIEVRARSSNAYGSPAESITPAKARRLVLVLESWRQEHTDAPPDSRIDFIGISLTPGGAAPTIELVKNAVEDSVSG